MNRPVDICMWAGEEHYTVGSFIKEAREIGVSKRISRTAIPEGIVPGKSRILIKHRKAIVSGDLDGVLEWLWGYEERKYTLPDDMLQLVIRLEELDPMQLAELTERFELEWSPGVIGYTYITSVQYVCDDNEEGLPEDLAHMKHLIEPVRVEYEEEDNG